LTFTLAFALVGCGDSDGATASASGTGDDADTTQGETGTSASATMGTQSASGGSDGTQGSNTLDGTADASASNDSSASNDATASASEDGSTAGTGATGDGTAGTGDDAATTSGSDSGDGGSGTDGGNVCPPDDTPATFSYIWIANTSQGTVSKIDTDTGVEEGRYYTHPSQGGGQPSRTSVNQYGDVAVSNRDPGSTTKVAALESGCVDANMNGMIDTSTGPNDIRPWGQDECVLWHTAFPLANGYSGGVRPTAWEGVAQDPVTCETPVPRLWIAYKDAQNTAHFVRLDGADGAVLDDVLRPNWSTNSFGPYGGAVNSAGDLFAIGYDNEVAVRIDADDLSIEELGMPAGQYKYGMGVDSDGNMWVGSFFGPDHMYFYDAQLGQWQGIGNGGNAGSGALGVQIDQEGRVWGAANGPCRLIEVDVATKQFIDSDIALPGCVSPWGVSIDNEGYVWVVDKANQAFKVDPDTYQIDLVVTGLVNPYTYSDMTGQGLQLVLPQ
jgi:hypothetical protein